MVKTPPFYPRLAPLSETMLWKHWSGYAAAQNYQFSTKSPAKQPGFFVGLYSTSIHLRINIERTVVLTL